MKLNNNQFEEELESQGKLFLQYSIGGLIGGHFAISYFILYKSVLIFKNNNNLKNYIIVF